MYREMLKAKIHRATVTEANVAPVTKTSYPTPCTSTTSEFIRFSKTVPESEAITEGKSVIGN
jgi:hypothetical protein